MLQGDGGGGGRGEAATLATCTPSHLGLSPTYTLLTLDNDGVNTDTRDTGDKYTARLTQLMDGSE